jgi:hypothetical protein
MHLFPHTILLHPSHIGILPDDRRPAPHEPTPPALKKGFGGTPEA